MHADCSTVRTRILIDSRAMPNSVLNAFLDLESWFTEFLRYRNVHFGKYRKFPVLEYEF